MPRRGGFERIDQIEDGPATNVGGRLLHLARLGVILGPACDGELLQKSIGLRLAVLDES